MCERELHRAWTLRHMVQPHEMCVRRRLVRAGLRQHTQWTYAHGYCAEESAGSGYELDSWLVF